MQSDVNIVELARCSGRFQWRCTVIYGLFVN